MKYRALQSKGFTMVELLVSIGIFMILTGVVLAKYRTFDTNAKFANASEDVVLALRQAQVYGVGAKGNAAICKFLTKFDCAYGVRFSDQPGSNNEITFFVDKNGDLKYTAGEEAGFDGISVKWGNSISIDSLLCSGNPCTLGASVVFKRPSPDAIISESTGPTYDFLTITLKDANTGKTSTVTITKAGQISLK